MRPVALFFASFPVVALAGCDGTGTTEPHVDAIAIRQVAETLEVGQSDSLSATLVANGVVLNNVEGVRWTSSDTLAFGIDSVSGVGRAKAVATPTTISVSASYGPLRASAPVVIFPDLVGLEVVMSASVAAGHTVTPLAGVRGDPVYGTYSMATLAWGPRFESSNPDILRVNSNGTLTALAVGSSRVSVTLHGKRAATDVAVENGYGVTLLPGTESLAVADVNDGGDVLAARGTNPESAVLVRGAAQLSVGDCSPRQVNNRGQVLCGNVVWKDGSATNIFAGGSQTGVASGLNENGEVFGLLATPDSLRGRGFVWSSGALEPYVALLDGLSLQATTRMNMTRFGLGQSTASYSFPVVLREGGYTSLAPLEGRYATAFDINDASNIVGSSENTHLAGTAAIWLRSQSWNGEILGPRTVVATAISERDEVVGLGADGVFVWKSGKYRVLADIVAEQGWTFTSAPQISRAGIVAAAGANADGRRGIVLVTLPSPGAP